MQNNFISRITGSIRFIILLLLIIIIFIAKSPYLLMFLTTLIAILMVITKKSVNVYIKLIKKFLFLLLFILLAYIIVYDGIGGFYLFLYKVLLILFLIKIFFLNFSFADLHSAIYTLMMPFKHFKVDLKKMSYNISIYVIFLTFLLESGESIKKIQIAQKRKSYSFKNCILPRLFLSINEVQEFEDNLKLKFYNLKLEKINCMSVIVLVSIVVLFITAVFKEVIL